MTNTTKQLTVGLLTKFQQDLNTTQQILDELIKTLNNGLDVWEEATSNNELWNLSEACYELKAADEECSKAIYAINHTKAIISTSHKEKLIKDLVDKVYEANDYIGEAIAESTNPPKNIKHLYQQLIENIGNLLTNY